jgi:hypothetical protein
MQKHIFVIVMDYLIIMSEKNNSKKHIQTHELFQNDALPPSSLYVPMPPVKAPRGISNTGPSPSSENQEQSKGKANSQT